jgi:hypothetical protein
MEKQQLVDKIAKKLAIEKSKSQVIFLHKYVVALVLILIMFMATFPLAYLRVSLSDRYQGKPFKTLDWQDAQR